MRSWLTLAILSLLYVLSFVDRFILALLVDPLKAQLSLSNVQIGILFGTAFAAFYGLSSIPLARVADTRNRKWLIILCAFIWSSCTIGSAFATNFQTLAALRFGLAIGEAALTPAALSLLIDIFPAKHRTLSTTLFSSFGMAGSAAAYVIGSLVIDFATRLTAAGWAPGWESWQLVFIMVGIPGILLALLLAVIVREPTREGEDAYQPPLGDVWRHLRSAGWLYPGLFFGAGFTQLVAYTLIAWGPTFLTSEAGMGVAVAGSAFGAAQFLAAVGGTLTIPLVMRKCVERGQHRLAARLPIAFATLGAAIMAIAPLATSAVHFLICHAVGGFLLIGTANSIVLLIQPMLPARMRALITALALICISSFGLGLGPPLAAMISDALSQGSTSSIGTGITGVALLGLLGAGLFLVLASRRLASLMERTR